MANSAVPRWRIASAKLREGRNAAVGPAGIAQFMPETAATHLTSVRHTTVSMTNPTITFITVSLLAVEPQQVVLG